MVHDVGNVRIAPLGRPGVEQAVAWADAEGWNPGVDDVEPFLAADPDGFLGGWVDTALAVTIAAVRYGPGFGFLGLYIATPAHRGHGLAYPVWGAARAHLADCAVVGLDAVLEQESTYARDGFATAHGTTRHALASTDGVTTTDAPLVDAREVPLEDLVAYEVDGRMFPARRAAFLAAWVAMPSAVSRALVDADGRVRGWGLRRQCRQGHKVGPLFADDPGAADAIWRSLVAGADGPVFLDVPDPGAEGRLLVERYAMRPVFSTRRMYLDGRAPDLALDRVYGVTTLELG